MTQKSKSVPTEKPIKLAIKIVPDPNIELSYPRLYSNHAEIRSSPYDFTLRFCDALPLSEKPKIIHNGIAEIKAPIKAEIIIPLDMFPNLIKAMQDHYDKHKKAYEEAAKDEKEE
jgi:hypothetical protein